MSGEAVLGVDLKPVDRNVQSVRLMVNSWVLLATEDRSLASRVTVACAELVEAAARRQFRPGATVRLNVRLSRTMATVELVTDVNDVQAAELQALLDAANDGTPVEAYTRALSEAGSDSVLGFARIRYEGQMTLRCSRIGTRLTLVGQSAAA